MNAGTIFFWRKPAKVLCNLKTHAVRFGIVYNDSCSWFCYHVPTRTWSIRWLAIPSIYVKIANCWSVSVLREKRQYNVFKGVAKRKEFLSVTFFRRRRACLCAVAVSSHQSVSWLVHIWYHPASKNGWSYCRKVRMGNNSMISDYFHWRTPFHSYFAIQYHHVQGYDSWIT